MSKIVDYIKDEDEGDGPPIRIPVVECDCGSRVECWDNWVNTCDKCGCEYNRSGAKLAPRSQWGEETGETFREGGATCQFCGSMRLKMAGKHGWALCLDCHTEDYCV